MVVPLFWSALDSYSGKRLESTMQEAGQVREPDYMIEEPHLIMHLDFVGTKMDFSALVDSLEVSSVR